MEILDTRGIAESEALNENIAENTLIEEIGLFCLFGDGGNIISLLAI